jgi:histidyl-tRNA synthetase
VSERFKAPRGTIDVLPAAQPVRRAIEETARRELELAGYERIETPVFEDTELFARGVGASTEVVQKQMFSFTDQGDRELTLRPEGTAAVCRAYIEHGMQKLPQPVKLWTSGPFFRHERPQAGRYRQFTQVDAEAIGSDSPLVDAELILVAWAIVEGLGVPGAKLTLGSLGSVQARAGYLDELREYLRANEGGLSSEVRERIDLNPLRAFDAADPGTQSVMEGAPRLLDRLEGADADHFAAVRAALDSAGVPCEVDPTMVRGLDYYSRTVFEIHCDNLGAQSQVGGGGRYDGLIEQLGGPSTPAMGWALGVDRIALALTAGAGEDAGASPAGGVFIVVSEEVERERALMLVTALRRAGVRADLDLAGRSQKGQMKQADRFGAISVLLLAGGGSASVRDMRSGEQREVDPDAYVSELAAVAAAGSSGIR